MADKKKRNKFKQMTDSINKELTGGEGVNTNDIESLIRALQKETAEEEKRPPYYPYDSMEEYNRAYKQAEERKKKEYDEWKSKFDRERSGKRASERMKKQRLRRKKKQKERAKEVAEDLW